MNKKIKYLKKHKFQIILAVIILLISFAIVFFLNANRIKREKALYAEDQKQLSEMNDYLNEVDEVVTSNTETLESISLFEGSIEDKLSNLYENLSVLDESVSIVESNTTKYLEDIRSENGSVISSLSALTISQEAIKEQISSVSKSITLSLEEMRKEDDKNFTHTFNRLNDLELLLEKLDKNTKSYFKDITNLISALQTENRAEHKELLETLSTTSNNICDLVEAESYSLQLKMDENYTSLLEKHTALHNQIADTKADITNLLRLMGEDAKSRHKEIQDAFSAVAASLEVIQKDYAKAHNEIKGLISTLQETEILNHSETLSTLTLLETNMEETAIQNLSHITDSLQVLQEKFETSISNFNQEVSKSLNTLNTDFISHLENQTSNLSTRFDQLNTAMDNQYTNISTTITNNGSNQQVSFDDLKNVLLGKLNEVFTYVSNGKKKCASALLTKSITIREDAAFEEIYQAILNIPQTLVIGVEQLPGTISYDHHYHVNHAGDTTHKGTDAVSGGCYTKPSYHRHTIAQGCYKKVDFHTHNDSCDGEPIWVDWNPSNPEGYWGWKYTCGNSPNNDSKQELICGKSNSTVDYYTPACGLSDGQIIGAHIVYNQDGTAKAVTQGIEYSEKTPEVSTSSDDILELPIESVSGNALVTEHN